jgi:NAD(P)H dehydrogenase (quinone)
MVMKVLTVYAHHNPRSFCHAVLERFCTDLEDAGHSNEVVDLYAIGFDPVFRDADSPNWIDDSIPDDVLACMNVEKSLLVGARNALQRWRIQRWISGLDARGILRKVRRRGGPRDVAEQQAKVARADALAFISPVYFMGFPAILKGWIERVFTLGFAFALKPEAWRGDITGRMPLLRHDKALIINTIWDERAYAAGLGAAMQALIDEYSLRYPGIQRVEHVYFHAVHGADDATRRQYLDRAYELGRTFAHFSARGRESPERSLPAQPDGPVADGPPRARSGESEPSGHETHGRVAAPES